MNGRRHQRSNPSTDPFSASLRSAGLEPRPQAKPLSPSELIQAALSLALREGFILAWGPGRHCEKALLREPKRDTCCIVGPVTAPRSGLEGHKVQYAYTGVTMSPTLKVWDEDSDLSIHQS